MSIPRNLGNFADNVNTNGKVEVTGINATGTPSASTALLGDGTWGTVTTSPAGSTGQVQYNNAGAFGASSNLTFNGTTLTAANTSITTSETLSYGTANGVTYLNGSKVLTSGSALTFNGTSLGIGSSSYGDAGTITASIGVAGTTAGGLQLWASSAQEHYIQWGDSTTGSATYAGAISYSHASDFMRFWTNSTEQMRLTSTGLGIGTSSPAGKLHVEGGGENAIIGSSTRKLYFRADSGGVMLGTGALQTGNSIYFNEASNYLYFSTASTERARISSTGGFSVGTTADAGAGGIYATGNITAYYSDARLKTVKGKIENALDKVATLSGVIYTNNDVAKSFGYESDEEQVGVLAQEIEAVMPQIVKPAPFDLDENGNSKSGQNYKTVQYDRLVPLLIEAINELRAEVKALKGE